MRARFKKQYPESVTIVRHGQSAGNVALDAAHERDLSVIEIDLRDVDVALSELGQRQAMAAGKHIASLPDDKRPTVILTSPYIRAQQTAQFIQKAMGPSAPPIIFDERLREREFGILDRLTRKGIIEKFPDQAELRARLQKFYYRPPGGESWCDVILRLRSVQDSLSLEYADERVLIVCHTVVILCFRYLFEKLSEEQILQIDREQPVANCSLTSYLFKQSEGGTSATPILDAFNFVAPLENEGQPVTRATDMPNERGS